MNNKKKPNLNTIVCKTLTMLILTFDSKKIINNILIKLKNKNKNSNASAP